MPVNMTPRENLLSLVRRQGYQYIPCEFSLCPALYERFKRETGESHYEDYFAFPWRMVSACQDDADLSRYLPWHNGALPPDTSIDMWGVGHQRTPTSMHMTRMISPLKSADSVEQIMAYPMPTFSAAGNAKLYEQAKDIHARGLAVTASMQCTVWETAWYMRGMENLMMDMLTDSDMATALLDRVTDTAIARAEIYADIGVDILFLGDDVGMQRTLMMRDTLYEEWLQVRLKRVIDAVKRIKPDTVIFYHSCGYVEPLIPNLIAAGVDVLNPVQPECMAFERIHAQYGDVLSFSGTIGTQTVMPFGTPNEVKANVRKNLNIAGAKGGLFVSPTHILEPEVPWDNVRAYVQACMEYTL